MNMAEQFQIVEHDKIINKNIFDESCYGAVAQSEERPSKGSVWCNSIDVGSNHAAAKGARH